MGGVIESSGLVARASLVAQMVKNLPVIRETWIQSLGWKDLLENGISTHSSIFVWRILRTEEPGELQSMGSQRVEHDRRTDTFMFTFWLCGREKASFRLILIFRKKKKSLLQKIPDVLIFPMRCYRIMKQYPSIPYSQLVMRY